MFKNNRNSFSVLEGNSLDFLIFSLNQSENLQGARFIYYFISERKHLLRL